jgi:hypothetical protein
MTPEAEPVGWGYGYGDAMRERDHDRPPVCGLPGSPYPMYGLGDLALCLGGDNGSFTLKVLELVYKAGQTIDNLRAMYRGFPRQVRAYALWMYWAKAPDPPPTGDELLAVLNNPLVCQDVVVGPAATVGFLGGLRACAEPFGHRPLHKSRDGVQWFALPVGEPAPIALEDLSKDRLVERYAETFGLDMGSEVEAAMAAQEADHTLALVRYALDHLVPAPDPAGPAR